VAGAGFTVAAGGILNWVVGAASVVLHVCRWCGRGPEIQRGSVVESSLEATRPNNQSPWSREK
jgi:hypothetical protein